MIGSRLAQRRPVRTVTVKKKTLTSGKHVESNLAGAVSIPARFHQVDAGEAASEGGAVVVVNGVFGFEPVSGSLPAIEEKHVIVDDDTSERFEVVSVKNRAGAGNRLKVSVKKLRST